MEEKWSLWFSESLCPKLFVSRDKVISGGCWKLLGCLISCMGYLNLLCTCLLKLASAKHTLIYHLSMLSGCVYMVMLCVLFSVDDCKRRCKNMKDRKRKRKQICTTGDCVTFGVNLALYWSGFCSGWAQLHSKYITVNTEKCSGNKSSEFWLLFLW